MKQSVCIVLVTLMSILFSCSSPKMITETDYGSPCVVQELANNNTFRITIYSEDETYGYTPDNPIMVGGALDSQGPLNERRFLNALSGPKNERIRYERVGSCCSFKTKNGLFESGQLDTYRVTYEGLEKWLIMYINMYDSDILKVPMGFKIKKLQS